MFKIILSSLFIFTTCLCLAQVSNLNFAQSLDTYQMINGTVVDAPNEDDIFHPNLPLGFTFNYNGNNTTKFGVCTNGFLVLDSLNHQGNWLLNPNSVNQICAMMTDLRNTNAGGSIEYVTVGTAPNRVCIIQWKNYGIFGNQNCHLNFQVRLFETSNCIQLYYGSNILSGNNGKNFAVGLIGSTISDFNMRKTNADWINTQASLTYNNLGMFLSPLCNLPNGLVYSFGICPLTGIQFSYFNGHVFADINGNGIKDIGENGLPNILIHETNLNLYTSTDTAGNYSLFFIDSNNSYSFTAIPLTYWNISTTPTTYTMIPANQNTNNKDFGLHPTPNVHDVTIAATSSPFPFPNATINFFATYHNNGTVVESGDSIFFIKDSHYTFLNSNPAPTYLNGDSVVWVYNNLLINEYRNISMQLKADTIITIGDTLHSYWTIKPIAIDTAPANNYFAHHQPCFAAFDPNSKEVSPDGNIIGNEELYYTIHFQNTGTASALNVFIKDTLSSNLDISTFNIRNYSHNMTYTLNGNGNLEFTFANINLPDSNANEPASHGAISYSIKPKAGLNSGTYIYNTAHIIFDYNAPIVTNTTQNMIFIDVPNSILDKKEDNHHITLFPNPTQNELFFKTEELIPKQTVIIREISGKIVQQSEYLYAQKGKIDISRLTKGTYIIQIINNQYSNSYKINIQ